MSTFLVVRAVLRSVALFGAAAALSACVTETVTNPYFRGFDPERAEAHVWVGGANEADGPDGPGEPGVPDGPPPPLRGDTTRAGDDRAAASAEAPENPYVPPAPPRSDGAEPRTVSIPAPVVAQLDEFMATSRMLVGEVVEVDMSRNPFLAQSVFTIDKTAVQRTDAVDERRGVVTIVLINTSGVKTVMNALPQVRFDNLRLVAVDRLILRYWTRPQSERPIHVRAVARGKAIYDDGGGSLARGERIAMDAGVVDRGAGYEFEHGKEVQP